MKELSLHIMDIAMNCLAANANLIEIHVAEGHGVTEITVSDNGFGMPPEHTAMATDPFFSTKPGRVTGMGLPLFKMSAELTGGSFTLTSEEGAGTSVCARYNSGHIDMLPLGAINETVAVLISCNPDVDFVYTYTRERDGKAFTLDTRTLDMKRGAMAYPAVLEMLEKGVGSS